MMTPGIIVGGKLLGWFTATESGAMAVLYALFLAASSTARSAGRN